MPRAAPVVDSLIETAPEDNKTCHRARLEASTTTAQLTDIEAKCEPSAAKMPLRHFDENHFSRFGL